MPFIRRLPPRKDGKPSSWQATVRHPNGQRLYKSDRLKRVVEAWAAEKEATFRTSTAPLERGRNVTVSQWAERWMLSRNVESITAVKDVSQINTHVLPHWGTWPLQSIGRLDVQSWVKGMTAAGKGADTVSGSYHRFAAMLSDAVLEGLIGASPCREIDLPRVVRPDARWLTRGEYDRIQAVLAVRKLGVPHSKPPKFVPDPDAEMWQAFVGLGCFSGLRPGELAGLDVGHLDLERRLAQVRQVQTRHGLRDYPKSTSSARWVPFPEEVAVLLRRAVGERRSGPVFVAPGGGRVDDRNFARRVWAPALEAAGIDWCRVYVMRHTAASWMAQAGISSDEIADILGHSTTRITREVYRHMNPERHDRVRAMWAAEAVLDGGPVVRVESKRLETAAALSGPASIPAAGA